MGGPAGPPHKNGGEESQANQAQIRWARVHETRAKQIKLYKESRAGGIAKQANQSKPSMQVTIKQSKVKQASKQSRSQIAIANHSANEPRSRPTKLFPKQKTTTPLASQSSRDEEDEGTKSFFKIAQSRICCSLDSLS